MSEKINTVYLLELQFDVKRLNLSSIQLYDSSCDHYILNIERTKISLSELNIHIITGGFAFEC